jgi:hypothetical protein
MDAPTFRANFPEFPGFQTFPDSQVNFWLGIAAKMLNADRWGDLCDHGLQLFTAHHLTMSAQNAKVGAVGGIPGATTGAVSGKTVDKVSVTYDTSAGIVLNAGHYNLTTYGSQFIQLAKMMGAGGIQLTGAYV